jgi:hypothetical protein
MLKASVRFSRAGGTAKVMFCYLRSWGRGGTADLYANLSNPKWDMFEVPTLAKNARMGSLCGDSRCGKSIDGGPPGEHLDRA